ncbi:MAG: AIR carboxylase family protein, partial [Anaerolineae bacterium]|nr:AIR carboxylase family protein [Anaerolineae bacterium]
GVPVKTRTLQGVDSLLSIVQMPAGVPVATMAIGNAKNAGLMAARILGVKYPAISARLEAYAQSMIEKVDAMQQELEQA